MWKRWHKWSVLIFHTWLVYVEDMTENAFRPEGRITHISSCVYMYIYIYIYIQISNCQFWRKDLAFELFTVNSVYKIIVGLSWFFVLTSLFLHSSESRHTNQLCSISQCNSDSLLNEVNDFPWIWGNLLFMYLNPFYL